MFVCISLVSKRDVFFLDCVEVYVRRKHELVVPVEVPVDAFELLLELLNVFLSMRAHLLELLTSPFESVDLVLVPGRRRGLELDLCLDDVELLLELIELLVVHLQNG